MTTDPDQTLAPGDHDLTPAESPAAKALETPLTVEQRIAIAFERIAAAAERIADVYEATGPAIEEIPRRMGEANEHARSGVGG